MVAFGTPYACPWFGRTPTEPPITALTVSRPGSGPERVAHPVGEDAVGVALRLGFDRDHPCGEVGRSGRQRDLDQPGLLSQHRVDVLLAERCGFVREGRSRLHMQSSRAGSAHGCVRAAARRAALIRPARLRQWSNAGVDAEVACRVADDSAPGGDAVAIRSQSRISAESAASLTSPSSWRCMSISSRSSRCHEIQVRLAASGGAANLNPVAFARFGGGSASVLLDQPLQQALVVFDLGPGPVGELKPLVVFHLGLVRADTGGWCDGVRGRGSDQEHARQDNRCECASQRDAIGTDHLNHPFRYFRQSCGTQTGAVTPAPVRLSAADQLGVDAAEWAVPVVGGEPDLDRLAGVGSGCGRGGGESGDEGGGCGRRGAAGEELGAVHDCLLGPVAPAHPERFDITVEGSSGFDLVCDWMGLVVDDTVGSPCQLRP